MSRMDWMSGWLVAHRHYLRFAWLFVVALLAACNNSDGGGGGPGY